MIEDEKFHPNDIEYISLTPLSESVQRNDVPFAKYLLEKGARVNRQVLQIQTSEEISALLREYAV